jgi:hypothetical protein
MGFQVLDEKTKHAFQKIKEVFQSKRIKLLLRRSWRHLPRNLPFFGRSETAGISPQTGSSPLFRKLLHLMFAFLKNRLRDLR